MKNLTRLMAGSAVTVVTLGLLVTSSASGAAKPPRFGGITRDVVADGRMQSEKVPEYVGVWRRDGSGIAGYISREDLLRETNYATPEEAAEATRKYEADRLGSIRRARSKVVDENLKLVGWFYAEIGFVSLEEQAQAGFDLAALLPAMK